MPANWLVKVALCLLTGALFFLANLLWQKSRENIQINEDILQNNANNQAYNLAIKKYNDTMAQETEILKSPQDFGHFEAQQRERFSKIADGEHFFYSSGLDISELPDVEGLDEILAEDEPII